jgi:nickel transport protein
MLRSLLALVAVLVFPLVASAHGMAMEVKVSGSLVSIAVYFDDDSPGVGASVKVFDSAKQVVAEGTTDAKGEWSFAPPPPGEYIIRARTDDGHAARQSFSVSLEPPSAAPTPTEPPTPRLPRLLLLGVGLLVVSGFFAGWYWVGRRRRGAGLSPD